MWRSNAVRTQNNSAFERPFLPEHRSENLPELYDIITAFERNLSFLEDERCVRTLFERTAERWTAWAERSWNGERSVAAYAERL